MNSIYKVITISRFLSCFESSVSSPINLLFETCKRYSLELDLPYFILTGTYPSLNVWKKVIKQRVINFDSIPTQCIGNRQLDLTTQMREYD